METDLFAPLSLAIVCRGSRAEAGYGNLFRVVVYPG